MYNNGLHDNLSVIGKYITEKDLVSRERKSILHLQ